MTTEISHTTTTVAVAHEDDEPQRITLREVYTSVVSLRREMVARIAQVEEVGRTDRASIRQEIETARISVARSEDIASSRILSIETRVAHTDDALAQLSSALTPLLGWYEEQKEEAQARAAWRGRISKFVFGSGLISFLTFLLAVAAVVFRGN